MATKKRGNARAEKRNKRIQSAKREQTVRSQQSVKKSQSDELAELVISRGEELGFSLEKIKFIIAVAKITQMS